MHTRHNIHTDTCTDSQIDTHPPTRTYTMRRHKLAVMGGRLHCTHTHKNTNTHTHTHAQYTHAHTHHMNTDTYTDRQIDTHPYTHIPCDNTSLQSWWTTALHTQTHKQTDTHTLHTHAHTHNTYTDTHTDRPIDTHAHTYTTVRRHKLAVMGRLLHCTHTQTHK